MLLGWPEYPSALCCCLFSLQLAMHHNKNKKLIRLDFLFHIVCNTYVEHPIPFLLNKKCAAEAAHEKRTAPFAATQTSLPI